jgi:hypothetical protein
MYVKMKPSAMGPSPMKEATSHKYISDGSGRDFYITYNSGGLEAPYIPGTTKAEHGFIKSLRSGNRDLGHRRLATPAERQRMKKSQSAQRLLVTRLTATSKEWKMIAKETRRQSISRERELRSPQAMPQSRYLEYQVTRNEGNNRIMADYKNLEIENSAKANKAKYNYPVYARSTRNFVSKHYIISID